MVIRAVFFDLDDTLVDFDRAAQLTGVRAITTAAEHYGLPAGELLSQFTRTRAAYLDRVIRFWGTSLREFRQLWFGDALRSFGIADGEGARYQADRYTQRLDEELQSFPDVEPALDILTHRYQLGVISNGWAELQGLAIERLRLRRFFKDVILAEGTGVEKPDTQIFRVALNRIGCVAAEAVQVGDSLAEDVAGARGAGLLAVWVNRTGRVLHAQDPQPHYVVTSLAELPEWLLR